MLESVAAVTIRDALVAATQGLTEAGSETPRLDAELLLAESLRVPRSRLVLDADAPLDRCAVKRFAAFVARRRRREPVAYILRRKDFRHITLSVDPRVLIPRPESELLVEIGLELPERARVLDVGTGSGAVALALKHERPDLEVWGSDVSEEALEVARANAERLRLEVTWTRADLLDRPPAHLAAVLANPPYVETGAELPPEIARYEPAGALFAGPDGLDVIRRLVSAVDGVPLVALEVGAGQAPEVGALLRGAGFAAVEARRDLGGHERVVIGRR